MDKVSGSTGLNPNGRNVLTGHFLEPNGRPSEVFHYFLCNRLEQNFQFHLRNSVLAGCWHRHFQCLPVGVVHGQLHFYLIVQNNNCKSDATTLWGFSRSSTKKNSKKWPASLRARDGDGRPVQTRLFGWKAFRLGPECFRSLPPEILPKFESAPRNHRFPTSSVQGTNGDLSPRSLSRLPLVNFPIFISLSPLVSPYFSCLRGTCNSIFLPSEHIQFTSTAFTCVLISC